MEAERASATVEFTFKGAREAGAVQRALRPEESLPASTRCRVSIQRRKNVLWLRVDAKDTAALRAALNSFLRWAIVARDMIESRGNKWRSYHLSCAISSRSSSRPSSRPKC